MSEKSSFQNDLSVRLESAALAGRKVDFIVSAGIASIEAPKTIRELRRHGAEVRVILTPNSQKFVQKTVFEWASAQPVIEELSGLAEHISSADLICVYPCTLDFLAKISLGLCDSAASTLVQSLLERRPVFIQTSMHESLRSSPSFAEHYNRLSKMKKLHFFDGPFEEGKYKALDPGAFADQVCHFFNREYQENPRSALVLSGPTRSYIDDLRYVSNYSSGETGFEMARQFYRMGYKVFIVSGPASIRPPSYISTSFIEEASQMKARAEEVLKVQQIDVIVFAAAVLDFELNEKEEGKISSKKSHLDLQMKPSPKLISQIGLNVPVRVGFKLESGISLEQLKTRLKEESLKNKSDFVVGNLYQDLKSDYKSVVFLSDSNDWVEAKSKKELAKKIYDASEKCLKKKGCSETKAVL